MDHSPNPVLLPIFICPSSYEGLYTLNGFLKKSKVYFITCENHMKFKFLKFYQNTATLIRLHTVHGCFCATTAELSSWGKALVVGLPRGVPWLRIRLPTRGTRVWSLVQADPEAARQLLPLTVAPCTTAAPSALQPVTHNPSARARNDRSTARKSPHPTTTE